MYSGSRKAEVNSDLTETTRINATFTLLLYIYHKLASQIMSSPRVPSNGAGIDLDKQALMSASPRPGTSSPRPGKVEEISTRDQVLPIMAYCAASIMMTVVNKVSRLPWVC